MITVSNEFKQAMLNRDQTWLIEVEVNYNNGADQVFITNNPDNVSPNVIGNAFWENGLVIEDSIMPAGTFALGGAIINKATLTLANFNRQFDDLPLYDAELLIYVGLVINGRAEMIQKGAYYVRDVRYEGSLVVITAYDRWVLFDKPYSESTLSWGAGKAAETVIYSALQDCWGLGYTVTLPHNYVIESKPNGDNLTFRDVLRYIAETTGCFLKFDNEGILKAVQFDWQQSPYYVINGIYSRNLSYTDADITGINILVRQSNQSEYTLYSAGTNERTLVIRDNPIIDDWNANTICGWLRTEYMNKPFTTGSVSHLADPCLEAGDVAYIEDQGSHGWYRFILVSATTFSTDAAQVTSCATNSGNYYYSDASNNVNILSDPSIKRSDIVFNVAATVGTDSTSVPNNTAYDKGNFTLDAGTYSVTCTVIFAANATGNRRAWLSRTSGGSAITSAAEVHVAAAPSGSTHFQFTCYLSPQVATTYYLVVQQNSGSSLNCTTRVAYLGVKK